MGCCNGAPNNDSGKPSGALLSRAKSIITLDEKQGAEAAYERFRSTVLLNDQTPE